MSLDMLHLATCGRSSSVHSVEERFPFANAVPKMQPSQIIICCQVYIKTAFCEQMLIMCSTFQPRIANILEDSLLWNLLKIKKHVWKNQHQNDSTYNKSCTLSGLVCLEIVLVLISNYKHFILFYRKADFDKLLDSCITIYLVLGNWSWHILQDICQHFTLTIMMLQSVVRHWISQCCSNTMLQFNVQQYTPLVLKRRFTQLLHTANRCKLTLQIVKPIQTDVFQYSITIMSVPACVGHHFPQCVSFLMLHMDVQ